jgi:hypothetical protein
MAAVALRGQFRLLAAILLGGCAAMPTSGDSPNAVSVTAEGLAELRLVASFEPEKVKMRGVTVRDGLGYAVAGYGGFFALDVADPDGLTLVGKCRVPGNAVEVALSGRYAYVAARPTGVQIIDVQDPTDPRVVGLYDSVELATGLDVAGNILGLCNRSHGVEFADLSDPTRPRHLSALRLGEAQGIRLRGDLAYVGLWHNGKIAVVDLQNPRQPVLRGQAALGGYGWGLCLRDDLVYAATGHHTPGKGGDNRGHGLDVVDISDPDNPRSIKRFGLPPFYRLGNDWWWAKHSGHHLFHADGENGVFVYDLGDPANPVPVAHADTADFSGDIALLQDRLLVADMTGGLRLFAAEGLAEPVARPPEPPREITRVSPQAPPPGCAMYHSEGQIRRVAMMGDHAIAAAGMAGLEVLALSPEPRRIASLPTPGVAFDVKVKGHLAYAALGSAGVAVVDVSDPLRPQIVGRLEGRAADHVEPAGEHVAIMRGEGGVDLLDVRQPDRPRIVGRGQIPHFPSQLSALPNGRLLGVSPWEIALFDTTEPEQFTKTILSQTDRDGALGAMVSGGRALICRQSELQLWDLADPGQAHILGSVELPARTGGVVCWSGSRAVISNRVKGVVTFVDVGGPREMRAVRTTSLPGYPGKAEIHGDLVLIPCGYSGLAAINWRDLGKLPPATG